MSILHDFARVTKRVPCPICSHPDWCMVSRDSETSPSRAICQRVESAKRYGEAGWLHVLRDDGARRNGPALRVLPVATPPDPRFALLAEQYAQNLSVPLLGQLTGDLGLTCESLRCFDVGWTGNAWSFPMRNEAGVVVGIALRRPDGSKLAVKGSKLGLFVPRDLGGDRLLVCEGQSDAAAALDLGFSAIGRPGARSTRRVVCEFARRMAPAQIVVVGDRDDVGQSGALELATALAVRCADVRVVTPPEGVKDLRAWRKGGAIVADVESMIAGSPRVVPGVRARTGGRS